MTPTENKREVATEGWANRWLCSSKRTSARLMRTESTLGAVLLWAERYFQLLCELLGILIRDVCVSTGASWGMILLRAVGLPAVQWSSAVMCPTLQHSSFLFRLVDLTRGRTIGNTLACLKGHIKQITKINSKRTINNRKQIILLPF